MYFIKTKDGDVFWCEDYTKDKENNTILFDSTSKKGKISHHIINLSYIIQISQYEKNEAEE